MPTSMDDFIRRHRRHNEEVNPAYVKLFLFQGFKAFDYLHNQLHICHRDIKPTNILCDAESALLKICDFGSAKRLSGEAPNVAYIGSRFYRAPGTYTIIYPFDIGKYLFLRSFSDQAMLPKQSAYSTSVIILAPSIFGVLDAA